MKLYTLEDVRKMNPCYDPAQYVPESWTGTLLDILHASIPAKDKIWFATRAGVLDNKTAAVFAAYAYNAAADAAYAVAAKTAADAYAVAAKTAADAYAAAYAAADAANAVAAAAADAYAAAYAFVTAYADTVYADAAAAAADAYADADAAAAADAYAAQVGWLIQRLEAIR